MGSGALATEMELTLFFTMSGLNIIRKGGAEKILLPGAPKTLPEFLKVVQDGGAKMIACLAAFPMVGIKEKDLIEGVECGGVTVLAPLSLSLTPSKRNHLVGCCNLLADSERGTWLNAFDKVSRIHLSSFDARDAAENSSATCEEVRKERLKRLPCWCVHGLGIALLGKQRPVAKKNDGNFVAHGEADRCQGKSCDGIFCPISSSGKDVNQLLPFRHNALP